MMRESSRQSIEIRAPLRIRIYAFIEDELHERLVLVRHHAMKRDGQHALSGRDRRACDDIPLAVSARTQGNARDFGAGVSKPAQHATESDGATPYRVSSDGAPSGAVNPHLPS